MSWLRIDDGFTESPKIEALTDREFRVWVRLLCYCARQKAGGELPELRTKRSQIVPGLSAAFVAKLSRIGLIDDRDSIQFVHDFAHYNPTDPTAASRMQRFRDRNADRNADRNDDRNETVTRARARAVPVPSRPEEQEQRAVRASENGSEPPDDEPGFDEPTAQDLEFLKSITPELNDVPL